MGVFPDFDGLGGIGDLKRRRRRPPHVRPDRGRAHAHRLRDRLGDRRQAHGNYATASKGRTGVLVALGAAVLAGGGVAWMNWLLTVGSSL
jgi:hypothetical protein